VLKVAVFVSGRGSNLKAILNSPKLTDLITVDAVISDRTDCPAFEIARNNLIDVFSLHKDTGSLSYNQLAEFLVSRNIGLIVLAGFLKMIPSDVISNFKNKIINIHPALLPSFGGKGMYGMNVHRAVFNSSAQVSGATVHFVDESYDTGKIVAQKCVDISNVNSPGEIAEKVLKEEHKLLPFVIEKFAEGKIIIKNNRVYIFE